MHVRNGKSEKSADDPQQKEFSTNLDYLQKGYCMSEVYCMSETGRRKKRMMTRSKRVLHQF